MIIKSIKIIIKTPLFFLWVAFLVSACGGHAIETDSDIDIIDFRNSFVYEPDSSINKLLIGVNSRLQIKGENSLREYILLNEHPRESTFISSLSPYSEIVAVEKGASFITFIYGLGVDSVIVSRRYSYWNDDNIKYNHECRGGKNFEKNYNNLLSSQTVELKHDSLFESASVATSFVGVFEYSINNINVKIDFPVSLINFNPLQNSRVIPRNLLYQVVSAQVPVYIAGHDTECNSIVPGYLSFREIDGGAQAVYMCNYIVEGRRYYDYGCVIDLPGKLRIFSII
jgi:hypothetical protein